MMRVAAAKGYAATTVDDVAEAAGVSRDVFHEHFEDKQSCFLAAFGAANDVMVASAAGAYESRAGEPWPERVAATLRALVELLAAEVEIARMTMVEVAATGDEARSLYEAALARFTPFLEEGRAYTGRDDLPAGTERFAIGGATSMVFDEIRAGRGAELAGILPELVFAVLVPYLGAERAEEEMRRVASKQG
jgi:AcrR family transcriptional regulator